jgi:DNA-binding response OmpR family regulator
MQEGSNLNSQITSRRKRLILRALWASLTPLICGSLESGSSVSSESTTRPPRHLVFGPFAFDETSGELRKHEVRLRLEGQPLQILVALIRQPGQIVARDELQQELWEDGTFVDFDHGLNAAMNRLRQVLGTPPISPVTLRRCRGGVTVSLLRYRKLFRTWL